MVSHALDGNVDLEDLRESLDYNPETGIFTWLKGHRKGKTATCQSKGYVVIRFRYRLYPAHRLAWLIYYGSWPSADIDHINLCRSDNRIANLREASQTQNNANMNLRSDNTSGRKGVKWRNHANKWAAHIQVNGKSIHLGYFVDKEEAHRAYNFAAEKYFGAFARSAKR